MPHSRRSFLASTLLSVAGGLVAACGGSAPAPAATPAAPSGAPAVVATPSPAATPAPAAAAAKPSAVAAASPVAVASPSAAPAPVASARQPARQMYQQDAQHSGRSAFAGPREPRVLRRFDMSAPDNLPADARSPRVDVQSSGVVGADGTFYVANIPGVLFALRDSPTAADQLEVAWRFHPAMASSFHATPALSADGSTLYLGFTSGGFNAPGAATLYALNTASGQPVWSVDMGATRVMASPTVGPDGTVYVTTAAGQLFAVDADGKTRFTAQVGPAIKSAVALASDGMVYSPSSDGKLYAVSPQGQVKWTFDFGEHLGPTPLLTSTQQGLGGGGGGASGVGSGASPTIGKDGTIYIGANNSNLYAVTPDGSMKWLFEAERELAGIWTTPALSADGAVLYFGANKGGIYAVNAADGSRRWQYSVYGSIYASSLLDNNGVVFTGSTIEHLYASNATTGEPLWDLDVHNEVWCAPALRPDGTLVFADRGGIVQVIG